VSGALYITNHINTHMDHVTAEMWEEHKAREDFRLEAGTEIAAALIVRMDSVVFSIQHIEEEHQAIIKRLRSIERKLEPDTAINAMTREVEDLRKAIAHYEAKRLRDVEERKRAEESHRKALELLQPIQKGDRSK